MIPIYGRTLDSIRTAVYFCMYAILGLMMSIPGPTLIDLQHSSRTDAYGVSFIFVARSSGYLVGSIAGGILLDFLKRKEIAMMFSSFFIAVGAFTIPFSRNLPMLLGAFVITGFAIGFSNTGCNASCLQIWGKKSAPILQGLHLLYGCGALLAPLIAAPFLEEFLIVAKENATIPSNSTFELLSLETFLNGTVNQLEIPEGSIPTIIWTYIIVGVLAMFVSCCFAVLFVFVEPQKQSYEKSSDSVLIRDQDYSFSIIVVALACVLTGLSSGIEVSFTQMLTSYVVNSSHQLSKSKGSYITSVYWISFTIARLLSIFLTCKIAIRNILAFSLVLSLLASIVLLTCGAWSTTALWSGAAILGVSMAPLFPGVLAWVERYIDINNRTASVFTLVSCLLEMVVPFTISLYLSTYPTILFCFLTGASTLASILFITLNIIFKSRGEKYETSTRVKRKPLLQASDNHLAVQ